MAEFTAAVYQNEFLPDGGTDVNAIVTVTCTGPGSAGPDRLGRRGRDHHRRHLRLDGADQAGGGQAGRLGRGRPDHRRHLVRGGRRNAPGVPGLPPRTRRAPAWCRWTPETRFAGPPGDQPVPLRRRHGDGHLADPGRPAVRLGADAGPEARDPADRRREPQRDPGAAEQRHRRGRPASSSATAAASGSTGRSRRSGGSPRRCSAPSTSSPTPRQMGQSLRRADAAVDGPRRRRRPAPGVGPAGRPGDVRPPGRRRRWRT